MNLRDVYQRLQLLELGIDFYPDNLPIGWSHTDTIAVYSLVNPELDRYLNGQHTGGGSIDCRIEIIGGDGYAVDVASKALQRALDGFKGGSGNTYTYWKVSEYTPRSVWYGAGDCWLSISDNTFVIKYVETENIRYVYRQFSSAFSGAYSNRDFSYDTNI